MKDFDGKYNKFVSQDVVNTDNKVANKVNPENDINTNNKVANKIDSENDVNTDNKVANKIDSENDVNTNNKVANKIESESGDEVIEINLKRPFTNIAATENSTKSGVSDFDDLQQEINREPLDLRKLFYLVILIVIFIVAFFLMSLVLNYIVGYGKKELKDVKGGSEDIMTFIQTVNSQQLG